MRARLLLLTAAIATACGGDGSSGGAGETSTSTGGPETASSSGPDASSSSSSTGGASSSTGSTGDPPPEILCDDLDVLPRGRCDEGLCWVWPYPSGDYSTAVFADGDELFLGGVEGIGHRRDGEWSWGLHDQFVAQLEGVSASDLYALTDDGSVLHFDGNSWSPVDLGSVPSPIWRLSVDLEGNPYLLVGALKERGLWRREGDAWVEVTGWESPECEATVCPVDGMIPVAPDDLWLTLAGAGMFRPPTLAHFDGESWEWSNTGFPIEDAHVLAPNDIWVAGFGARHYDGEVWEAFDVDGGGNTIHALASDDIWIGGGQLSHWDGVEWTNADLGFGLGVQDLTATADGTVWSARESGSYAFDGQSWDPQIAGGVADGCGTLPWLLVDHGDGQAIAKPSDGQWELVPAPDGATGMVVRGSDDVFAFDNFQADIFHYDGESWTELDYPHELAKGFNPGLVLTPSGRVYVVTTGYDDTRVVAADDLVFERIGSYAGSAGVAAAGVDDDLWFLASGEALVHVDAEGSETRFPAPDFTNIHSLHVLANDAVWAIGAGAAVWDGETWSDVCGASPAGGTVHDGALWVLGIDGVYRFTETTAERSPSPLAVNAGLMNANELYGDLWISSAGQLWGLLPRGVITGNIADLQFEPISCD